MISLKPGEGRERKEKENKGGETTHVCSQEKHGWEFAKKKDLSKSGTTGQGIWS